MSFPTKSPRRRVLWSPAALLLCCAISFMPLGMLYVSADPRMGPVESALVVVLVTGLYWLIFVSAFGRTVWIGSRRVLVNGPWTTTRLALADIQQVTVVEWGGIRLRLRDGREVKATSHQRGPRFPFPTNKKAERVAGVIRQAARPARPRRGGPVTLERTWWPVPVYLGLSVVFCQVMRFVFTQTY